MTWCRHASPGPTVPTSIPYMSRLRYVSPPSQIGSGSKNKKPIDSVRSNGGETESKKL